MLSPQTIYLRSYQLRRLAEGFPDGPWTINPDQLAAWLGSHGWAAGTVRSWRAMLGSFYRWAVVTGRIKESPAALLPRAPVVRLRPRPVPDPVVDVALQDADERLELMILLGRHCGMRRGEIARASTSDIEQAADGWWILVHGKGGKDRPLPLPDWLHDKIVVWMGDRTGFLFPGQIDGHLAPASVGRMVSRHLPGAWTTHTLRHRFGTDVWSVSHDLAGVQELLGHEDPKTTRIYVEVDRARLRQIVEAAAA